MTANQVQLQLIYLIGRNLHFAQFTESRIYTIHNPVARKDRIDDLPRASHPFEHPRRECNGHFFTGYRRNFRERKMFTVYQNFHADYSITTQTQRHEECTKKETSLRLTVAAQRRSFIDQTATRPPSTAIVAPFTKLASGPARNSAAAATSSTVPGRPAGKVLARLSTASPNASDPGVRMGPGAIAFTVTPCGPYSAAHAWVRRRNAAFDAP